MMRNTRTVTGLRLTAIAVALACTPAQSRPAQTRANNEIALATPVIDSARPDSVEVPYGGVVEVTLYGNGFLPGQPGRNTVHFDRASLGAIAASPDGRRITFVIPDQINSGGEAPPRRLVSGSYAVSVETGAGTSNVVNVRVYR